MKKSNIKMPPIIFKETCRYNDSKAHSTTNTIPFPAMDSVTGSVVELENTKKKDVSIDAFLHISLFKTG